jgi:hypothetical protein
MFDGTSADGHCVRYPVQPTLHGFQYMFVLPSSDAPIVAGRTSRLERATRASAGPVHLQIHVVLNCREPKNCALASRAPVLIVLFDVDEAYLTRDGCIVDQRFQSRLPDGMIRCHMGADKVVRFGHQFIKALLPSPPEGPDSDATQPGPRIMHAASAESFQALRASMEHELTPQMNVLDIDRESLPVIWDADFLYGPRSESGEDTYVLCEINVSSVFAIPDQAPAAIARLVNVRLHKKYPLN